MYLSVACTATSFAKLPDRSTLHEHADDAPKVKVEELRQEPEQQQQQQGQQQRRQQQQEPSSDGYIRFLGLNISKDDLLTITLALAISYGIRW